MSSPLDDYKDFIESMVRLRPSVSARRVETKTPWPAMPEFADINQFLATLSDSDCAVVVKLLQQSRDSGIHDVLAYLNDAINCDGLRLVRNARNLPVEPFGTELYYDWHCRCEGDPWPTQDAVSDSTGSCKNQIENQGEAMSHIAAAGNVEVRAYLALLAKGYQVDCTAGREDQTWLADGPLGEFSESSHLELLGLITMREIRGADWHASDDQIEDFMGKHDPFNK